MLFVWVCLFEVVLNGRHHQNAPLPNDCRAFGVRLEARLAADLTPGTVIDLLAEGQGQNKSKVTLKRVRVLEVSCRIPLPNEANKGEVVHVALTRLQLSEVLQLGSDPRPRYSLTGIQRP